MNKINFKILALASLAFGVSTEANAQWSQTKNVDAFTDKTTIITKNVGRIIDGLKGSTSLIHRTKDGVTELYWNTPDGFLCEATVMARVDGGTPFPVAVNRSTDRESVFFQNRSELMEAMLGSMTTRFKLTDSCGGYMVAEFIGNADSLLPEYATEKNERLSREANERILLQQEEKIALEKKTAGQAELTSIGWTLLDWRTGQPNNGAGLPPNNDFIQYKNDNSTLTYRKSLTLVGPPHLRGLLSEQTYHEISFAIKDEKLITSANSFNEHYKQEKTLSKTKISVGKKRFDAKTMVQYDKGSKSSYPNSTTGVVAVFLVRPSKVEELYNELIKTDTQSVEIKLNGTKYEVPVANFSNAVKFYE